jgi:hypothetical protein
MVNNKIYVGVHKTVDVNDGYMGSGKVIKRAIEKYGRDNFRKDILEFFETPESMYAREKEVVTDAFLVSENTYNLRRGGTGGFDYINRIGKNKNNNLTQENRIKGGVSSSKISSERLKLLHKQGKMNYSNFTGRIHSEDTKNKMRQSHKNKHMGVKNSQYGSLWITNGIENKKIKKDVPIPDGWNRGRKI